MSGKSDGRGAYVLPERPAEAAIECFRVYIPNRPEYRRAVLGSLDYLSKWVAWERDAGHGARSAAALFFTANALTVREWAAGNCEECKQEDCMSCHSCCCGGGGPSWLPTQPPQGKPGPEDAAAARDGGRRVDDLVNPPPGFETRADYDQYKCKAARSMAVDLQQTIRNMGSIGGLITVVTVGIFAGTMGANVVSGAVLGLLSLGLSLGGAALVVVAGLIALATVSTAAFAYFGMVADEIDIDRLSCNLYDSTNEAQARTAIEAEIGEALGAAGIAALDNSETFAAALNALVKAVTVAPVVGALFAFVQWVEDAFQDGLIDSFDCSSCGAETGIAALVVNQDATYSPAYQYGSPASQPDAVPVGALVNDGIQLWDGGNSVSWWGANDAIVVSNNGATGITVTMSEAGRLRFRHARTSDFGTAASVIIRSVVDNSVIDQATYNTAKIVPEFVTHPYVLAAGQSYRVVFAANNVRNHYFGGFEIVP